MQTTTEFTNKSLILLGIIFFVFSGCTSNNTQSQVESAHLQQSVRKTVRDAKNNVSWSGMYQGVLPCRNCEGVAISLSLSPNMTYMLRTRLLGVEDIDKKSQGSFHWLNSNSYIELDNNLAQRYVFRVGDQFLELVAPDGTPIKSDNPNAYYLEKTSN